MKIKGVLTSDGLCAYFFGPLEGRRYGPDCRQPSPERLRLIMRMS